MPGWIFTHIASGEKRDQVTAARLKRMGVTAGWPDLMFFGIARRGVRHRIEGEGRPAVGSAGRDQAPPGASRPWLSRDSSDYREVVETLKGWGVLRSGIHVQ